jgi:transcriptional regulator with XRE-family HTH domain
VLSQEQLDTLRRAPVTSRNKLALAMLLADVRQEQLVEKTGLTQGYISKIKNGRYQDLKPEAMQALAEFFGCAAAELFPDHPAVA